MGCFLACFGGRKDRKRRRPAKKPLPVGRINESYRPLQAHPSPKRLGPNLSPKKPTSEEAAASLPELKLRENHEQGSSSSSRKKVTFDLNVKTYEEVSVHECIENSPGEHERSESIKEEGKQQEGEDSSSAKPVAFPANHRYQNCESSYDEDEYGDIEEEEEEEEYEDCDLDEEEDDFGIEGNEEESYDSYFSLPLGKEGQNIRAENESAQEVNSPQPTSSLSPDREPSAMAKGNARDRSQYVYSVLNPVENLSQWKEVKVRAATPKNPRKENIDLELENKMVLASEPTFKVKKPQGSIDSNPNPQSPTKQEISVDASLSTWLVVSSENTAKKGSQGSHSALSNSSVNREERPILGALTVEDIKQSSATPSPRRSPSRSPDDIPILGTVGSYWNSQTQRAASDSSRSGSETTKGIPNTTSKYREDRRVNWHSTPFEVRLERALNKSAA